MLFYFILILLILVILLYLEREPYLDLQSINDNIVLSPAFGKIAKIETLEDGSKLIIIILNYYDIHYQYYPVNGILTNQERDTTGRYEIVFDLEKSKDNEKVITVINSKYVNIKVIQMFEIIQFTLTFLFFLSKIIMKKI